MTCDDCGATHPGSGGGWPPPGWTMRSGGNLPKTSILCRVCDLKARAKAGDEWAQRQLAREGIAVSA